MNSNFDPNAPLKSLKEIEEKSGSPSFGYLEIKAQRAKNKKRIRGIEREKIEKEFSEKYPMTPERAERMAKLAELRKWQEQKLNPKGNK